MEAGGGGIWSGGRGSGPLSVNPRVEFLRSLINLEGRGLEIGPGYNPLVPKAEGFQVETADYTDAAGLRAKYAEAQVDASRIEEVDHVLEGGQTLAEAIGRPGAFDYLVASHVIEHTPDLLGFLKSCETLLAPDGVLLLAIPDKRHCFDVFQPLTTTGSVLQAHLDGRIRPTPGAIFDDLAYNAVRGDVITWPPDDARSLRFFATFEQARSGYETALGSSDYRDVHVWRFVPSSFRLIVRDLHALGVLGLKEAYFHDSVGFEFYVTLSRSGRGCDLDRLTLAKQALSEQATILVA